MKHCKNWILLLLALLLVLPLQAQRRRTNNRRRDRNEVGSFVNFSVATGVSSLGYQLYGGRHYPMPAAKLAVDYIYYFTPTLGLGTGLGLSYYGNVAAVSGPLLYEGLTDYQGQTFTHRIDLNRWREMQHLVTLELPVAFHYKYKPYDKGWFTSVALKLSVPLAKNYVNTSGDIVNSAYYPLWDLQLRDLPGRFETVPFSGSYGDNIPALAPLACVGYFEIGGLWQLTKRTDLRVSAFADICMTNLYTKRNAERTRLGFAGMGNSAHDYMPAYDGLIGTDLVRGLHPWSAGVKVATTLYCQLTEQQKRRKVREFLKEYDAYIKKDTVYIRDTVMIENVDTVFRYLTRVDTLRSVVHEVDTVERVVQLTDTVYIREQVAALDSLLSEAVIWFRFDEYVPILEPADILDRVVEMLRANPTLRVHVNGHACDIGTEAYNRVLALRRAKAVAELMRQKGVRPEQMIVASFGATEPFRYNKQHQRAKDRRVEIIPFAE